MKDYFKGLYIFLCVLLTLIMTVWINTVYATGSLTITVESVSATPGDVVDLNLTVNNNPGFNALTVGIVYPDGLSQINIVNNIADLTLTKGSSNVWDSAEDYKGNGTLATVSVKIADDVAPGAYTIRLLNCMAANENFSAVHVTACDAVITVKCAHKNTESRPKVSATCQNSGTEAGVYCSDCKTYISGGAIIPATGIHTDLDGKWETDDEYHWHTCSCGELFEKTAHTAGAEATCVSRAQCKHCNAVYGEIAPSKHNVSTEQLSDEKYIVPNTGINCKDYVKYYYACCDCKNATSEIWTSTKLGGHNYGILVAARGEIHTPDELVAAVAAHYRCTVCNTYFTDAKIATTLAELTGAEPMHTFGEAYSFDADNHWKECSCGKKEFDGNHIFNGSNGMICDICKYDRSCKHIQSLQYVAAKPNTCTENGNKEYWICNECNIKFKSNSAIPENEISDDDVVLIALGHSESSVYFGDGVYHWKICDRENCGAVIESTREGHNGVATCEKQPTCFVCNQNYGAALGHSLSKYCLSYGEEGHARECTNVGCNYTEDIQPHDNEGALCEACGFVYHICGKQMIFVPSVLGNCQVIGQKEYYKCSCNKLYFDIGAQIEIKSLADVATSYGAHNDVAVPAVLATCIADGVTESVICSVCKTQLAAPQVIPALGHQWSEWKVILDPTEYADGSKSRECFACNEVEFADIPVLEHKHSEVEIPASTPTCITSGLTSGTKCAICGEIIVAQKIVPAKGHASVDYVAPRDATSTESGNIEYWHCRDCDALWLDAELVRSAKIEDVIIPALPDTEFEETANVFEETTMVPEETTIPTVPESGDDSVFLIISLVTISIVLIIAIFIRKKRTDN